MLCILLRIVCAGSDSSDFIESAGSILLGAAERGIVFFIVLVELKSPYPVGVLSLMVSCSVLVVLWLCDDDLLCCVGLS
jgi:hypothetical protein